MLKFGISYVRENSLKILTLALLCLLFVGNLALLKEHGFSMIRYEAVSDLSKVHPTYDDELLALSHTFTGQDPYTILQNVMDHVPKVEPSSPVLAQDIWNHAKNGGGALCGQMATLYGAALAQKGIDFRIISIARVINTRDSHVTVEVFDGENWALFDPTFNVSFKKGEKLIGAREIHDHYLNGDSEKITPVFHGDVKFPSRIEDYYLNWLTLYNNIQVYSLSNINILSRTPPMRYWKGPKAYYQEGNSASDQQYRLHNNIYFVSIVVFPLLIASFALYLIFHFMNSLRVVMYKK